MNSISWSEDGGSSGPPEVLWEDSEHIFLRAWRNIDRGPREFLAAVAKAEHPTASSIDRLIHEYGLLDYLDGAWAMRPVDLVNERGRTILLFETPRGRPINRLIGPPMQIGHFLRLATAISVSLGRVHQRGLVHKDIKPVNILAGPEADQVWLTGFGIASRLPREKHPPGPPETIAGTLAYMAPEQTGRMNRSVDARSDLYSLGITLYEVLTGSLPFTVADPMELVHCHIARQPIPPIERAKQIPASVSAIIMKLLAKTAEDRYQTATGLERDLRHCLAQFDAEEHVHDFALGEHDTPDRLLIPEKLYGRAHEIESLLGAFNRVVRGGGPELVLVAGYSGIGKSAVVNELQSVMVPPRGLFASGKFDQYKRDIPYSTLAQAFQSLVCPLLGKSDAELGEWREALSEALGSNGQLMVDLVPELKLIIGEQSSVPELPPQDAQRRFQMVFRQFIDVFARPEHPLALFLDDLQWLDAATLDLLEDLMVHPDLHYLLLVGAYRDNEVAGTHPFIHKLEAVRASRRVQHIKLGPLTAEDLTGLVVDSLRVGAEEAAPLTGLVHAKTGGNPFFVTQFLHVLADEGLLVFHHKRGRWSWDLGGIHAKRYTDNVVELLAGKLTRLPRDTQDALQQLACLGNVADIATLATVLGEPEKQVHTVLWEALRQQLIERLERSYKFVHDRVQEAAYALIPESSRAEAHLRIGRLLAARTPPERRDETVFEIVNQLNRGAPLSTSAEEREQLAELNLAAGRRAISSSAYASALTYLTTGVALLRVDAWERRQELAFELQLHSADCEVCTGALQAAEERLNSLAARVVGTVQRCAVARRLVDLYTMLGAGEQAVTVALECLRHVGIDLPAHPTEKETQNEYEGIWSRLGGRAIEDLVDLPVMQDPKALAMLDILVRLSMPALYTDHNLYALSVCKATNLTLDRGNNEVAPYSFAIFGLIASARFGDHDQGYRLAKMACGLIERHGWNHVGGRTYFFFAAVIPWTRPLGEKLAALRRAFEMGKEYGDPAFAWFASRAITTALFALGQPLDQIERQAEEENEFGRQFGFFLAEVSAPLALLRTLRGRTTKFESFDDERSTERSFENRLASPPAPNAFLETYYWVRKLRANFFLGDSVSAVDAADKAEKLYETCSTLALFQTETADLHFYAALSRAARCEPIGPDPYAKHREKLRRSGQQLLAWAANCPPNYEDRATLVEAEIARLEGRPLDAMNLYERAIVTARKHGFVHNEAIANEVAARFYAARGFETISHAYLRNARYCYLRWGADAKVSQLDQMHPHLRAEEVTTSPIGTIGAPLEQLDLATVMKVSQTVSAEMVLERLLDTLMRTAIEHAGAERGLLILAHSGGFRIEAEATTVRDTVLVSVKPSEVSGVLLPQSIFRYVVRTKESVLLHDASADERFVTDEYTQRHRARSVLCLPLLKQTRLIGILYLENNLSTNVFTPARISVLKLVASGAAISLENSLLYRNLREREARMRRLVDSNIVGIAIGALAEQIIEANDAFLRIVGYDRDDLAKGLVNWPDLIPAEWREMDAHRISEIKSTGLVEPYETELTRKDGTCVPVLVGTALFDGTDNQGVSFVLDLSDRKQAEREARESDRRYHEIQIELAHANRVAMLGQLSASIAHEISQPLSGIVTNASTGLRMLAAAPPNVDGARETTRRTIRDANRASEVIQRLRALFSKREATRELVDLNEAIREVIALSMPELQQMRVILRWDLTGDLPSIKGDRIQLQQVMLNLIRNAMDAMSAVEDHQRQLLIRTATDGADVLVTIEDTGPGLDPDGLDRIFGAFYSTKSDGLGMGLSICRTIITAHGGKLWAAPAVPRGAIFQFTLRAIPMGVA